MQRGMALALGLFLLFSSSLALAAPFGRMLCKSPGFTCLKVGAHQSWESLYPNSEQRLMVMQLNRMNTPIYAGMQIAVPQDVNKTTLMDFSPFPTQIPAPKEKVIFVDPKILAWGAYDRDGHLVRWGSASLGSDYCRDLGHRCHSPTGVFHIFAKGSVDCKSTRFPLPYGGAPMPYCMYFHGGFALHGEPNGLPGNNASHGCIRLFNEDAEWLSHEFVEAPTYTQRFLGTKVVVEPYGEINPLSPEKPRSDADSGNRKLKTSSLESSEYEEYGSPSSSLANYEL